MAEIKKKVTDIQFSTDETRYWFITEDGETVSPYLSNKSEGYAVLRSFIKNGQINKAQYDSWRSWIYGNTKIK